MPFPNIDPILLQIGPFAIRWYALAYVAGILLGWRYAAALVKNPRLWTARPAPATSDQIDDLILWITLGVIVGGRLGSVLFYTPSLIWEDPIEILKVWNGGMSFHGGVLGVLAACLLYAGRNHMNVFSLGDVITAVAPIGLFFGRIANFINGERWGRPTTVPWGVIFPGAGPDPRHPSQLYEAALEGLVIFLVLRWATHSARLLDRPGVVAGLFFTLYGIFRSLVETVREPNVGMDAYPLGLTMGMILSLPMIAFGLWLIARGLSQPPPLKASAPIDESR